MRVFLLLSILMFGTWYLDLANEINSLEYEMVNCDDSASNLCKHLNISNPRLLARNALVIGMNAFICVSLDIVSPFDHGCLTARLSISQQIRSETRSLEPENGLTVEGNVTGWTRETRKSALPSIQRLTDTYTYFLCLLVLSLLSVMPLLLSVMSLHCPM